MEPWKYLPDMVPAFWASGIGALYDCNTQMLLCPSSTVLLPSLSQTRDVQAAPVSQALAQEANSTTANLAKTKGSRGDRVGDEKRRRKCLFISRVAPAVLTQACVEDHRGPVSPQRDLACRDRLLGPKPRDIPP